jgi:hypothetical protein
LEDADETAEEDEEDDTEEDVNVNGVLGVEITLVGRRSGSRHGQGRVSSVEWQAAKERVRRFTKRREQGSPAKSTFNTRYAGMPTDRRDGRDAL